VDVKRLVCFLYFIRVDGLRFIVVAGVGYVLFRLNR
jgi:hypothetical protein